MARLNLLTPLPNLPPLGRVELFSLLLARHSNIPAIVCKGGDATPFMISATAAVSRAPGLGTFTCCSRNHVIVDEHGVEKPIPCKLAVPYRCCSIQHNASPHPTHSPSSLSSSSSPSSGDKDKIGGVMSRMLASRREYHLGSGDLLMFRVWSAFTFGIMQGLTHQEMPSTSIDAFLDLNRFASARDEEDRGSGYSPLIIASISGNLPIVRELIDTYGADVRCRVRVVLHEFGAGKGMDALGLAASTCPQRDVHGIVAALIASGADPNAASMGGVTPLIAAIGGLSLGGVKALLTCAGKCLRSHSTIWKVPRALISLCARTFQVVRSILKRDFLQTERHHWASRASCLHSRSSKLWLKQVPTKHTGEELRILKEARLYRNLRNRCDSDAHDATTDRNDNGSSILHDISANEIAQPDWMEFMCDGDDTLDINYTRRAQNAKWKAISAVFRMILRLGISRSDLVMDMAHTQRNSGTQVLDLSPAFSQILLTITLGAQSSTLPQNAGISVLCAGYCNTERTSRSS